MGKRIKFIVVLTHLTNLGIPEGISLICTKVVDQLGCWTYFDAAGFKSKAPAIGRSFFLTFNTRGLTTQLRLPAQPALIA